MLSPTGLPDYSRIQFRSTTTCPNRSWYLRVGWVFVLGMLKHNRCGQCHCHFLVVLGLRVDALVGSQTRPRASGSSLVTTKLAVISHVDSGLRLNCFGKGR